MSLSRILFFLTGRKSYFAAGVTLRSHEADLFSVFFFALNTGFELWCDAVCSIFSWELGVVLGIMFAGYVSLASPSPFPIIDRHFLENVIFAIPN